MNLCSIPHEKKYTLLKNPLNIKTKINENKLTGKLCQKNQTQNNLKIHLHNNSNIL